MTGTRSDLRYSRFMISTTERRRGVLRRPEGSASVFPAAVPSSRGGGGGGASSVTEAGGALKVWKTSGRC